MPERILPNYYYFNQNKYTTYFQHEEQVEWNKYRDYVGALSARRKGFMAGRARTARQANATNRTEKRHGRQPRRY